MLGILAAEAQIHQCAAGQRPGPLRGEGTLALQSIAGIHHLALDVSTHGHAAAHVADDEVQGLIGLADLLGVALGHGLLVQGVENAAAGDEGVAGVAGQRRQLIHHGGIHDVGGDVQRRTDLTASRPPRLLAWWP